MVERDVGEIVGVEVKASATVSSSDFKGLKRLLAATGAGFRHGIVFYTGERMLPFGDRLTAMPISALWT